jgi:hypothetical protein
MFKCLNLKMLVYTCKCIAVVHFVLSNLIIVVVVLVVCHMSRKLIPSYYIFVLVARYNIKMVY